MLCHRDSIELTPWVVPGHVNAVQEELGHIHSAMGRGQDVLEAEAT